MRVLVACEYSGRVRDAFAKRGHTAVSCDLLPSDSPHGWHVQGDVLEILGGGWDLMIAHPPCTHLAVSGARHFAAKQASGVQDEALEFVRALMAAPIPRICIENPVSIISSRIRKPLTCSAPCPRRSRRRASVASKSAISRVTRAARAVGSSEAGSVQIARSRSRTAASRRSASMMR